MLFRSAGSSGSVVARRLAEDPSINVLLLEAGGTDDAGSILNPMIWYTNIGGEFDWQYKVEPFKGLNNRAIQSPMGKALGGGSSINAMIWARGHKNDYEFWAKEAGDAFRQARQIGRLSVDMNSYIEQRLRHLP